MKIVCDACSAKYSIADEKVRGKVFKIRCKKCSNIIVVRGQAGEGGDQPAAAYDQKATKVFDYSGYDSPQDAVAAEAAGDGVWHLVIDQEQVGPMTVEEVKQRFERGEVDAETYVWREGFTDWERLADVDAFAGFVGGGGGGAVSDGAGLFGSAASVGGQSDQADLFAARSGGDDGAGSDLFSGGMAAASASASEDDDGGLFAGAGGGGGGAVAAAEPAAAKPSALTGQRNENSVLFSLNNLAALASDAPRSAPSPSHSSSSSSGSSSSASLATGSSSGMAPTEGSGLIDIRSMAQVYLGDSGSKPSASKPMGSPADDLPVFSQTSFEAASPVLLPTAQPAVNNRLLIALVGLIGVLVIAAVVLVVIVLKGGGDKTKVAAADTSDKSDKAAGGDDTKPATAMPAAAGQPAAAATPVNVSAETAAVANGGQVPGLPKSGTVGKAAPGDKKGDHHHDSGTASSSSHAAATGGESRPAPASRPPTPGPTESSGCDEVTCLVDPDKPCCKKGGGGSHSSSHASSGGADPNLPDRPSRSDVSNGIASVKGRVQACGAKTGGKGTVTVKLKIAPSGSVASATASGGTPALQSCVESAVRGAHFPKTQLGISVNYPFVF